VKPTFGETTVLGAAFAAGLAVKLWPNAQSLPTLEAIEYLPTISEKERDGRLKSWKKAVDRSLNWVEPKSNY
jgi:glycerol kinase